MSLRVKYSNNCSIPNLLLQIYAFCINPVQDSSNTASFSCSFQQILHQSRARFLQYRIFFMQFSANTASILCNAPYLPDFAAPTQRLAFTAAASSGDRRYAPRSGRCRVPETGDAAPRASSPPSSVSAGSGKSYSAPYVCWGSAPYAPHAPSVPHSWPSSAPRS